VESPRIKGNYYQKQGGLGKWGGGSTGRRRTPKRRYGRPHPKRTTDEKKRVLRRSDEPFKKPELTALLVKKKESDRGKE